MPTFYKVFFIDDNHIFQVDHFHPMSVLVHSKVIRSWIRHVENKVGRVFAEQISHFQKLFGYVGSRFKRLGDVQSQSSSDILLSYNPSTRAVVDRERPAIGGWKSLKIESIFFS